MGMNWTAYKVIEIDMIKWTIIICDIIKYFYHQTKNRKPLFWSRIEEFIILKFDR